MVNFVNFKASNVDLEWLNQKVWLTAHENWKRYGRDGSLQSGIKEFRDAVSKKVHKWSSKKVCGIIKGQKKRIFTLIWDFTQRS